MPNNVGRLVFREIVVVEGKTRPVALPKMIAFGEFGRDHEDGDERETRKKNEPDHNKLHHSVGTSRVCEM
jgi:hypothetical protein